MHLTDRLRSRKTTTSSATEPTITVGADGEIVIDLRDPLASPEQPTIAPMPCPNCGGTLQVDQLDPVAHIAAMDCRDCGFRSSHRLPAPR